jgi:hypothetical protein
MFSFAEKSKGAPIANFSSIGFLLVVVNSGDFFYYGLN